MDEREQLRLQAYLDGELPQAEAREVADQVQRDPAAAALLQELRQTAAALSGFEDGLKLPESREFYWSRIQRQIEKADRAPAPPAHAPGLFGLRRLLAPVAGLALVAIAVMVARPPIQVNAFDTALDDSSAFTYHDFANGATLVWLSYPADPELAPGEDFGTFE